MLKTTQTEPAEAARPAGGTTPAPAGEAGSVTVVVPLSGPHRLHWLREAIDSVPLDSPNLRALHVIHQGGPWDWGGELRERLAATPKVRLFEFDQRVDFASSFNRALYTTDSRWAMLLPDDDLLIRDRFARGIGAIDPDLDVGYLAFGWYELNRGRFVYDNAQGIEPARLLRGPPFCSTLFNVPKLREAGGFASCTGGFCDIDLYARLRHRYGVRISDAPVGILRIHRQQGGRNPMLNYEPFIDATHDRLSAFLDGPRERSRLRRRLEAEVYRRSGLANRARRFLAYLMRGRPAPRPTLDPADTGRWLAG